MRFSPDDLVDDVMSRSPQTIRAFLEFKMHCIGCPIACQDRTSWSAGQLRPKTSISPLSWPYQRRGRWNNLMSPLGALFSVQSSGLRSDQCPNCRTHPAPTTNSCHITARKLKGY